MPIYVGEGSIRAEIKGDLAQQFRSLVDSLRPGVLEVLEAEAHDVLEEARARWPVATGESRDGLYGGVQVAPDLSSARGFVANDVDHAVYVKSWKGGLGGKSAMVELLRKPIAARTGTIVAKIGALVKEAGGA